MNTKQAAVIQTVATQEWLEWKLCTRFDGQLKFSQPKEIGNKVFIQASNAGNHKWFEKFAIVQIVVGVRGGINELKVIY
jgi:uncharacterized protein YqcC (DUF446 family)